LAPYVEFVKPHPARALRGAALAERSLGQLARQLGMMPGANPFMAFKARLAADLSWLAHESLDTFHLYSFATLRQFGACYELAATYLRWLGPATGIDFENPAAAFHSIATEAKTLQFQLARAMMRKKPLDLSAIDEMATQWQAAMSILETFQATENESALEERKSLNPHDAAGQPRRGSSQ